MSGLHEASLLFRPLDIAVVLDAPASLEFFGSAKSYADLCDRLRTKAAWRANLRRALPEEQSGLSDSLAELEVLITKEERLAITANGNLVLLSGARHLLPMFADSIAVLAREDLPLPYHVHHEYYENDYLLSPATFSVVLYRDE